MFSLRPDPLGFDSSFSCEEFLERVMGIEPTQPAWKAGILPLNYTRTKAFPRAPGFGKKLERVAGIEPTSPAGKAGVLALNYARIVTIESR